jgi:8-oxo-dGTP diphosphatase
VITLAGCVILDEHGHILLIHRHTPHRTQWELPGGKIEEGEDPAAAATRELHEELGVRVEIVRQLGEQEFTEDGHRLRYTWFLANIIAGTPALQEPKYDALKYFSWEELRVRTDLSPNTRNLVAAQLRQVDLSSSSKRRRIRNEQLVEDQNQRIKTMAARILDAPAKALLPLEFTCECSDLDCAATIQMSVDEYNVAHQYPDCFVIKPGHEHLDIERVVSAHPDPARPDYFIIEKYLIGLTMNPDPQASGSA